MKRFSAVSLVILFSMSVYAQEKPSASGRQDPPPAAAAATAPEPRRKALSPADLDVIGPFCRVSTAIRSRSAH